MWYLKFMYFQLTKSVIIIYIYNHSTPNYEQKLGKKHKEKDQAQLHLLSRED